MQTIRSRRKWSRRRRPWEPSRGFCSKPRHEIPAHYRPRHFLLTKNEAAFFRVLQILLADHYQVSCKVRLADIVTCAEKDCNRGGANRISQKHIDFVVSSAKSSRIIAAIELDDSSHQRPERRARDTFLNRLFWQMGLRLIRVAARWEYDSVAVARQLVSAGLQLRDGRQAGTHDRRYGPLARLR